MFKKIFFSLLVQFTFGQNYKVISYNKGEIKSFENFDTLQEYIQPKDDELLVINFWATWCEPCVAEIPYFNQMIDTFKHEKIKLIFISLDFNKLIDKRLVPFLNHNNLNGENLHLADSRQNVWIDKVNKDWSGAIPATLFLSKKYNFFYEGELSFDNLIKFVNTYKL